MIPAGLAPEAAIAARDTLVGAAGVAIGLPDDLGVVLLDAARTSFSQGLHVAAAFSLVVAIGLSLVAAVSVRAPTGSTDVEDQLPAPTYS
jgi:DHA2 family multidrug resistance protein-like MFS transporter